MDELKKMILLNMGRAQMNSTEGIGVVDDGYYFEHVIDERVAILSDPVSVGNFNDIASWSCCGEVTIHFPSPWGPAIYGFNHGH